MLTPAAVRARRTRARQRQGMVSVRIDLPWSRFIDALVLTRRMTEAEASTLRREQLEREARAVIDDYIERAHRNR